MNKRTPSWMDQPQEIPDAEHEQLVARVCAIDVGKQAGKVCTRVPHAEQTHRRVCKVWDVAATTNAVSQLAGQLVDLGVEKVTVESTADYWRIWFYLLEAAGLDVQLVNARDVRNVPGRPKTDKLDAVWLAKLTEKGMLRPSFVPPRPIRVLRDYTRLRVDLTRERTRYWQRLEKLLEDSLIKVSSVASGLDTVSARDMVEALIGGERDPHTLAGLARGRMRTKHAELTEALTGAFDEHHGELARIMLDQVDALNIPGLLQTHAYAEALIRLHGAPSDEIRRRVEVRVQRQQRVLRQGASRLWTIIGQAALHDAVVDGVVAPEVMRDQLKFLLDLARRRKDIQIQILPAAKRWQLPAESSFTLLRLPQRLSDLVYFEHIGHASFLENPDQADRFNIAWASLAIEAQKREETLATLTEALAGLDAWSSRG